MFIDQQIYSTDTDMKIANQIRYWLHTTYYNPDSIKTLIDIASKYIDCLDASYDTIDKVILIKIKKTSMKKRHGFKHEPTYYYPIMCQVFKDFLINIDPGCVNSLIDTLQQLCTPNIYYIINNGCILTNLCFVSCISDNIISIKL